MNFINIIAVLVAFFSMINVREIISDIKSNANNFQFQVNFTEFTNLAYQIDRLNDEIYYHKKK